MLHYREVSFFIEDLTCKVCVRRALDGLRAVDGVVAVRVSSAPVLDEQTGAGYGIATLKYNPDFVSIENIARVLSEELGFTVQAVHEEQHPVYGRGLLP